MAESLREALSRTVHEAVPFVAITALWTLLMVIVYGAFLLTKPAQINYDPWVHVTVFLVPGIGYFGHVLREALHR